MFADTPANLYPLLTESEHSCYADVLYGLYQGFGGIGTCYGQTGM